MPETVQPIKPGRLLSLDVFRGMTIAMMLLVNNPGDWGHIYGPLEHASWNGCTLTDLVFPFFVFIVGVSVVFSMESHRAKGLPVAGRVFRRAVLLFVFGLVLNYLAFLALPDIHYLRPMGVLQRIALCYLSASILVWWFRPRGLFAWFAGLLVAYWLLMTFVPVPGSGAGNLTQEGNLASYLDTRIFHATNYRFDPLTGKGHDPEGLLSTLPAIGTALAGCLAGYWLRTKRRETQKAAAMAAVGVVLLALGALWGRSFPINKNLWTSSYVLFTAGWALVVLSACYWLVDIRGVRWWCKPFAVYGTNAITAYMGAGVVGYGSLIIKAPGPDGLPIFLKNWVYLHAFKSWLPQYIGLRGSSAAYGICYVLFWCLIMWVLYRKRIFLKV